MDRHTQIFASPSKYVQGRHALDDLGGLAWQAGCRKALVLGGRRGLAATRAGRGKTFAAAGIEQEELVFGGTATYEAFVDVHGYAAENGFDTIIGSGGGQALDIARLAADRAGLLSIMLPTTASTDAPVSSDSAMYSPEHEFLRVESSRKNPDIVLVDLSVIATAPARTLVAGMGDTLSTYFECGAVARSGKPNVRGGQLTDVAVSIGQRCLDLLLEYGVQAKIAAEAHVVTPAFAKIVEANTFFSGVGFESGGLAAAHAMMVGFTGMEELKDVLHGELVGYMSLMEMILEDHPAQLVDEVFRFCDKVGLPVTLEQIGMGCLDRQRIYDAVERSCEPGGLVYNEAVPISPEAVFDAILAADAMGKRLQEGVPIV
ncbi:MAG: glycerol dehydrogenase [Clostridiales Family XIII bacterium]|jgi:glycerol dehydrogenase|nr:glycerol dehydrogenase [Clostridiales Family XIII bacterium]